MKELVFSAFLAVFCASCGIDEPEAAVYEPFVCTEYPEERVYYPEETIIFKFNMPVNPNSLKGFSVSSENAGQFDSISAAGNSIKILPPLPAEDNLFVTLTSALKSEDNKPLMTGEMFTENKEVKELDEETVTGENLFGEPMDSFEVGNRPHIIQLGNLIVNRTNFYNPQDGRVYSSKVAYSIIRRDTVYPNILPDHDREEGPGYDDI